MEVGTGHAGVLDWGGSGPPLVLLHPNGFCAGLYEPVARRLVDRARVIGIDLPGHGMSSTPPARESYEFPAMARYVLAVLDRLGIDRAAVVGGSLGGAVAVLAGAMEPGRWHRALLAEPVAYPAPPEAAASPNPMAAVARRRRRRFPDRSAMVAALARREPLSQLAPEALDAYARWGTVEVDGEVALACDPEVEATIFEISGEPQGARSAWECLPRLSCPATVVAGRSSFLPDVFAEQAARAGAGLVVVPGGHFVLHEDTDRGARLIARYALAPAGPAPR